MGIEIGTLTNDGIMISRLVRYIHARYLVLGLYQDGEKMILSTTNLELASPVPLL